MDSIEQKKKDTQKEVQAASGNFIQTLFENLRTKRSWQAGAVILVLSFFAVSHFISGGKKKSEETSGPKKEETREHFKETSLKRMIDKGYRDEGKHTAIKPERTQRGKRNYATDIAVFVREEKEKKREEKPLMSDTARKDDKKLGLPPGTKIPAYISGTLFSFNVEAPVTAVVPKDIEVNGKVVIPKNSKFLGEADVLKSLDRINIRFELLVLPDGREVKVRAMALSCDGSSGIKGRVDKHGDIKIFKAIGETMLAGASLFTGGVSSDAYSLQDELRLNLAQGLTDEARRDLRNVNVDKSITVESYSTIQVLLLEGI